jgi:hypothetical protein
MAERDSGMLRWLTTAARELRVANGLKPVDIAVAYGSTESTIWRFEHRKGWPEHPDRMVEAYARQAGVEPLAIWERAMELWDAAPPHKGSSVSAELSRHEQASGRARGRKQSLNARPPR